jgi:hypothetical protein
MYQSIAMITLINIVGNSGKVRGHENTAELHPIWERVRTLFLTHFSGAEVATVEWKRNVWSFFLLAQGFAPLRS